ncbi:hypothetical protein GDO81_026615 [Engystomops pustulosus]|uniref:Uncharacterized protein n=1 Tax=Engystomops pustulosus TaxID=76066 RepID=A0AAV6YM94_ENGPU|nr:hypothetical protein GDO81_026615 [Engystomops pustulosus]
MNGHDNVLIILSNAQGCIHTQQAEMLSLDLMYMAVLLEMHPVYEAVIFGGSPRLPLSLTLSLPPSLAAFMTYSQSTDSQGAAIARQETP